MGSHPRVTWGRQLLSRPLPLGLANIRAKGLFSKESPSAFAGGTVTGPYVQDNQFAVSRIESVSAYFHVFHLIVETRSDSRNG